MADQILDKRGCLGSEKGGVKTGKGFVVLPVAVVFRGIDGFAEDRGWVQKGDGF